MSGLLGIMRSSSVRPISTPGRPAEPDWPGLASRRAPIRQAILDFLTTPKTPSEIAEQVKRPIPTITGHLRATCDLGLTKRLARSFYVIAGYEGGIPEKAPRNRTEEQIRLRHRIIGLLHDLHHEADLCRKTGAVLADVQHELVGLWRNGFLCGDREHGWQLRNHIKRRFPRSVRDCPE